MNQDTQTQTKKVLLLDDDSLFGEIIMRIAKKSQLSVDWVGTVTEFTKKANSDYDMFVVDYDLDDYTCGDVVKRIKSDFPNKPIAVVSQNNRNLLEDPEEPIIVDAFFSKWFGNKNVVDSIKMELRKRGR